MHVCLAHACMHACNALWPCTAHIHIAPAQALRRRGLHDGSAEPALLHPMHQPITFLLLALCTP